MFVMGIVHEQRRSSHDTFRTPPRNGKNSLASSDERLCPINYLPVYSKMMFCQECASTTCRKEQSVTSFPFFCRFFDFLPESFPPNTYYLCGSSWGVVWTVLTAVLLNLGQLLWQEERTLKETRERCYIDPAPTAKKLE